MPNSIGNFFLGQSESRKTTFDRLAPSYVDARVLAANTNEDHTIPSGARYVIFSSNADFYAKPGGSSTVPSGDVTDGTASELNPTIWNLDGISVIGLIAPAACTVTLTFYK